MGHLVKQATWQVNMQYWKNVQMDEFAVKAYETSSQAALW